MEQIIKKWEEILKLDEGKNIMYDRHVLTEMLEDFKAVKNLRQGHVIESLPQKHCTWGHKFCEGVMCKDCFYYQL
jgi:hypothetical protein